MLGPGRLPFDDYVLFALWMTAIVRIFWPHPQLIIASGIVLLIYVVLSFRRIRRQLQILSLLRALLFYALLLHFRRTRINTPMSRIHKSQIVFRG